MVGGGRRARSEASGDGDKAELANMWLQRDVCKHALTDKVKHNLETAATKYGGPDLTE